MFKKYLIAFALMTLVAAAPAFGQERNFDLKVQIDRNGDGPSSSSFPVTVTVLNRAEEVLAVSGLGSINFYFAKCIPADRTCEEAGEIYFASVTAPKGQVFENRSFNFDLNVSGLEWRKGRFNTQTSSPAVEFSVIPKEDIYFWADVKVLDGFEEAGNGRREPKYREYVSNFIEVTAKN